MLVMNYRMYSICEWHTLSAKAGIYFECYANNNIENMPKRPHPFDEDICRQKKMHVSEKEMSNGALKDSIMKKIYDNTTERLYEGVSLWYKSLSSVKNSQINAKVLTENNQADNVLCVFGHYVKNINISRCDYCDKSLCFSCLRECKVCQNLYCKKCAMEEFRISLAKQGTRDKKASSCGI